MKKTNLFFFVTVSIFLLLQGCAPVLIGLGAFGGYAISPDTVEGIYEVNRLDMFQTSKDILLDWSNDVLEDETQSELIATAEEKRVWVFIDELDPKTLRLRVKARKYGVSEVSSLNTYALPDIKTAQMIFERIVAPVYRKKQVIGE